MARLDIRDLPDEVLGYLKRRAALYGRSADAEARALLADICRLGDAGPGAEQLVQDYLLRRRLSTVIERTRDPAAALRLLGHPDLAEP